MAQKSKVKKEVLMWSATPIVTTPDASATFNLARKQYASRREGPDLPCLKIVVRVQKRFHSLA